MISININSIHKDGDYDCIVSVFGVPLLREIILMYHYPITVTMLHLPYLEHKCNSYEDYWFREDDVKDFLDSVDKWHKIWMELYE